MTVTATLNRVKTLEKLRDDVRRKGVRQSRPRSSDSLYDVIPRLARGYSAPRHLDPLVRDIERSWTEEVRGTYCAPPRHAKTETVLAAIAFAIAVFPHETNVYATYGSGLARSKARKIRAYAEAFGVKWDSGASNLSEMRTPEGGGLLATGVGAGLTGQGANRIFIDDPYKNRIDAESAAYRQMLIDWFGDVAETRVEPGGSVFIFHTRWHTDDLIGHVQNGPDKTRWQHRLMPAIDLDGRALWPERWSAEELRKKELAVGPYTWASLYQGSPRPRGGAVFTGVAHYRDEPKSFRVAIGVDLAYTAKTQADSSVAVVLGEFEGRVFVIDVVRRQVKAPDFKNELLRLAARYPGAPMRIYGAGTETGAIDLMRDGDVPLTQRPPKGDKFVRAQPVAAAWNRGEILVPAGEDDRDIDPDELVNGRRRRVRPAPEWVNDFLAEVAGFTGVNDKHDDQIDALAAAYDELMSASSVEYDFSIDLPSGL